MSAIEFCDRNNREFSSLVVWCEGWNFCDKIDDSGKSIAHVVHAKTAMGVILFRVA
jgi:hypothetical protein